ncbi:MAG: hypothetical protein ACLSHR_06680 [Oscillospiraceae bacterium]
MEFNAINGVILIEEVKSMPIWLQITAYFVTLAIFILDIYITVKVSRSIAEGGIFKANSCRSVGRSFVSHRRELSPKAR